MEISVIIPAYNEESVIATTLRDVLSYLKKRFSAYEVLVIDDGSKDHTVQEARQFSGVTVMSNSVNKGKGYSVRRGVLESKGDLILFMDADNSTNIRELNHFLDDIKRYDVVIGSRALSNSKVAVSQNLLKKFGGRLGNKVIRMMLDLPIRDTQCGFKLFHRSIVPVFKQQTIERWGFDFEILFLANKRGLTIHESPVTWVNNFDSKVKTSDYFKSFQEVMKVRVRYIFGGYSIIN